MSRAAVDFAIAADTGDILGESPCWDGATARLYWIDVRRPALHRLDAATGTVESWPMPELIGAVVPRRAGGMVVALRDRLGGFDPTTGALSQIGETLCEAADMRLNDAKCDRHGRLWFGRMRDFGADDSGGLLRFEAGKAVVELRAGIGVPNAICFSPDGGTVYVTDTKVGDILSAPVDAGSGACGPWSVFAAADVAPGRPDGATVDADGCLWNARFGGGSLARITPDGRLDRLVELPVSQPTSCAFGGTGLGTLYVTTARQKMSEEALAAEPHAGALLAVDVGVRGLAEPGFGPPGS